MKTIEITDEMYVKLIELATEMTTQDHRCTAQPYIFQIREIEQVPAADGNGNMAWFYDGAMLEDADEIIDALFEYYEENKSKKYLKSLQSWEMEDLMEEAGYRKIWYENKEVFKNAFLTAKGCKDHIERNGYHYNQPTDYLSHAFRNPEIELVSKFLCGLVGKDIHK